MPNAIVSSSRPCTKCGVEYPRTAEFFPLDKKRADGLVSQCKKCVHEYGKRYRNAHDTETRERAVIYRANNADKMREYGARYRANNPDKEREKQARYRAKHLDKIHERDAHWRADNPDKVREKHLRRYSNADKERERAARYRAENADKVQESNTRYRAAHPDKVRETKARYIARNPEYTRVNNQRRSARKNGLPARFTDDDTKLMMDYWNHCCAYCGKQRDFWNVIEADHFIAVTDKRPDNPGTVPVNMIPACKSCNSSKHNREPIAWVNHKFGKRKAKQILTRINAYFEWIKTNS